MKTLEAPSKAAELLKEGLAPPLISHFSGLATGGGGSGRAKPRHVSVSEVDTGWTSPLPLPLPMSPTCASDYYLQSTPDISWSVILTN